MLLLMPSAGKGRSRSVLLSQVTSKNMSQLIVLSAIGADRTGVVQDITQVILSCGGNIEESRMTTLGSEFAVLMLVSGNWHTLTRLEAALEKLTKNDDLAVSIRKTGARTSSADRMPYAVDVVSLDQQGIVFNLADFFAARDVEITDVSTRRYAAAHTGAPMFALQMAVNIPTTVPISMLRDEFLELCDRLNLDAILEPVKS